MAVYDNLSGKLIPPRGKEIHQLRIENARLRKYLLRIFDCCENWSGHVVKVAVAEALMTTVKELEIRP